MRTDNGKDKDEIQGSLHCGGKCAAFGRDDVGLWWVIWLTLGGG
jgi:hypothetical protein